MRRGAVAALAVLLVVSCGLPRDPEGTRARVTGGVMRVGVAHAPPWTDTTRPTPRGVEVALARAFAQELDARVRWVADGHNAVLKALELGQLDLVVAGLEASDPWQAQVTFTRPYLVTRTVVGVPPDQVDDFQLAGARVAAVRGSEAAGLLAQTDARPRLVGSFAGLERAAEPAAVSDWLLDDLGLRDAGVALGEAAHVVAVPTGENAWLVALERFLLGDRGRARTLLDAEGGP